MHDERTGQTPVSAHTPAEHDRITQGALLASILAHHPAQLTEDELIRDMASNPRDFSDRDAISRAIRDLIRAGLLHRHGPFVFPTHAAIVACRLLG